MWAKGDDEGSVVSRSGGRLWPEGSGEKHHSDVSRARYPRCTQTTDRDHVRGRLTFVTEATGLRRDHPPPPAFS